MSYTKGKWEAKEHWEPQWVVTQEGKEFGLICITSQGNDEANAKRICQCVNNFDDLLEALKDLIKAYTYKDDECESNRFNAMVQAEQVIVKAEVR